MKKVIINGVETEVADDWTPEQTPPNNPPNLQDTTPQSNQPVDRSLLDAYSAQLLEQGRENRRLREQLEARNQPPIAPPTEEEEKDFFNRPRASTQEIVRKELATQVAPINEFVQGMQRNQLIVSLKSQMKNMPNAYPYVTQVEHLLDQLLANTPQITPDIMAAAYNQAVGHFVNQGGNLTREVVPPNNPNSPVPPTAPLPPHVRSSPPVSAPRPGENGKKALRPLNENEKKIARSRKMTDAEYLFWTEEVSGNEVAHVTDDRIKEFTTGAK